jgi:amylosucrase
VNDGDDPKMARPHLVLARRLERDPRLPDGERAVVAARAERWLEQVLPALALVYPNSPDLPDRLLDVLVEGVVARSDSLRIRDRVREAAPDWFLSERMVGYVTYVDRFDGTIARIGDRLDHLTDLGVTYLHLMPLLHARPRPNDGGYAVQDFRAVDPSLGTMDDLRALAARLHANGISLCVDLVLNHTAAEHEWAQRARAGEQRYLDYYRTYPDRTEPDRWEQTLPEVFPDTAPGNFTWDEVMGRWVWTTFNRWQWDLDWSNPDVFVEMLRIILELAAVGIDVLRLDAVPFLWKRMGTDSQNLAEVHLILRAIRGLVGIAAPATILKGEAIVAPRDLVPYQGVGPREAAECDLLYHNQLMVQGWSSLAAKDGRLATIGLSTMAETPPHASWVTYVRCHDDIGWAIDDTDAAQRGWNGSAHRRFLSSWYAGELGGSPAEGAHFQEDFVSGDRRTSGTTAALVGLTRARRDGDQAAIGEAIDRFLLLYALAASYGGIPLIWMGDEIALDNDTSFLADPDRAADNRWLHRPPMDWARAERRHDRATVEGRVHAGLVRLMRTRAALPTLRAGGRVAPLWHDNDHVLAFRRHHSRHGRLIALANFHPDPQRVDLRATEVADLHEPFDALDAHWTRSGPGTDVVPGLSMRWISEP